MNHTPSVAAMIHGGTFSKNWTETKRRLMIENPHCTGCRERLYNGNCNLAADHLFCNWCINLLRQKRRRTQFDIIATMKRKLAAQDAIDAQLKAETRPAVLVVPNCAEVRPVDMDAVYEGGA